MTTDPNTLLNSADAAAFLGFANRRTLENWRCRMRPGPVYVVVGKRVLYRVADLVAFRDKYGGTRRYRHHLAVAG